MSRYIEADAIPNIYTATHQELILALEDAPSIDIVRCKECKFWKNKHLCATWSAFGTIETEADDFCSYGEKK